MEMYRFITGFQKRKYWFGNAGARGGTRKRNHHQSAKNARNKHLQNDI